MTRNRAKLAAVPDTPPQDRALDVATERLAQAEALSYLVHSSCGENFRNFNEEIQDNALWLLSRTIREAREAVRKL